MKKSLLTSMALALLFLSLNSRGQDTCQQMKSDFWEIQKQVYEDVKPSECAKDSFKIENVEYRCLNMMTIETKISSLHGKLANIRGLQKLKTQIEKHQSSFEKINLSSDFKNQYDQFYSKIQLAALIEGFLKNADSNKDWEKITSKATASELSSLCDQNSLSKDFCTLWKTHQGSPYAQDIIKFITNNKTPSSKTTEDFKKILKIKSQDKDISYSQLLDELKNAGLEKFDSNSTFSKAQLDLLTKLDLEDPENKISRLEDLIKLKDQQTFEALKDQVSLGINAVYSRQEMEIKEKLELFQDRFKSKDNVEKCAAKNTSTSFGECADLLSELSKKKSTPEEINFLANLSSLIKEHQKLKDFIPACLSDLTKCPVDVTNLATIQKDLDSLNKLKKERIESASMQRKLGLKNHIALELKKKTNCISSTASSPIGTCAVLDLELPQIQEFSKDMEKIVLAQISEEKSDKKIFCLENEEEELFKRYCKTDIKKDPEVPNLPLDDDAKAKTSTEAFNKKKNTRAEILSVVQDSATGMLNTYNNIRQNQPQYQPQQNWYQPTQNAGPMMNTNPYESYMSYSGFGMYNYNLQPSNYSSGLYESYFQMTPTGYKNPSYDFGMSSTSDLPSSVSNSMYGF